ncbi:DUF3147 family protein [Geotoga petraea]|uniref:DUF3147 family protein n=1 Tax=Geotoga petraea TaxID=28234 RepID=A0A4Z0VWG7_9BACT|nr:DUF3147 family protein [Geotoga petraea]
MPTNYFINLKQKVRIKYTLNNGGFFLRYFIKIVISALLIFAISEASKRFTAFGALIASLPLTSIIAIIWLYNDTHDISKIANLSWNIFWFVIPSLLFFILLPIFLTKFNLNFFLSMVLSSSATIVFYFIFARLLSKFNIQI